MKHKIKRNFCSDTHGFSTTFDIFLFLLMVSISAVILLPSIIGNTQIISALESKSQKQSSQVLFTLLNGRVDEFEYTVAGRQMDAIAGTFNESPIYKSGKKIIAGKELSHKTFADIAAEDAATRWIIYNNGKRIQLNFLMTDYSNNSDSVLKNYLDRQIGDIYNYNFTVIWRPFVNVPIGGNISIGEPVPRNAYTESAYITMPYHVDFTRKRVEEIINSNFNSSFGNISSTFDELKKKGANRTQLEEDICGEIFDSINSTIDDAVADIVSNTLGQILDETEDKVIEQVNNFLPQGNGTLDIEINDMINQTLKNESIEIKETLIATLTSHIQNATKQKVRETAGDEVKKLVTELVDLYVNNAITISEIKERILTEVFSRLDLSRAYVTLSIWEKRVSSKQVSQDIYHPS